MGSILRPEDLRKLITNSLTKQGFIINAGRISPPSDLDKDRIRELHVLAVRHKIEKAKEGLFRHESELIRHIAHGKEVIPTQIRPRLIEVQPESREELLFRYIGLHWSIPVSSGYGRRIRFLCIDESNSKVIGIIGLGDPVFSLSARDEWIGWDLADRKKRLAHVMEAFVLGAVPPYSSLLGGKLMAMAVASNEVRVAFKKKYQGKKTYIKERSFDGRLAMITTTSALGRSSIYNRLSYHDRLLFKSVGFTQGYGEFHFSDGLYQAISDFTQKRCLPTAKQSSWGTGFRNRREVVKKCLQELKLSSEWIHHGVHREIFVIPLAQNSREFLRGDHSRLRGYHQPLDALFAWFQERWMLPRVKWDLRYLEFDPRSYLLWL